MLDQTASEDDTCPNCEHRLGEHDPAEGCQHGWTKYDEGCGCPLSMACQFLPHWTARRYT